MNSEFKIEQSFSNIVLIGDLKSTQPSTTKFGSHDPSVHNHLWSQSDLDFFSVGGLRKSNSGLTRIHSTFKFYLDLRNPTKIFKAAPDLLEFIKSDCPSNVTPVVYNNNMSPLNPIPLTSWILHHRIPHSVVLSDLGSDESFSRLIHSVVNRFSRNILPQYRDDGPALKLLVKFLTMRSARLGMLTTFPDVVAELFAQHHFGGIKLKPSEDAEHEALNKNLDEIQVALTEFVTDLDIKLRERRLLAL